MLKKLSYILLVVLCTLISFSFQIYVSTSSFDANSVKRYIEYLSSDTLKGRLAGTIENDLTAIYLKNEFEKINLKPYKDSYFQKFDTVYPYKTKDRPYLTITDSQGFLVKEYKYGVDYKEDLLNFKKNNLSFTKKDKLLWSNEHLQIQKDNNNFLFYTPESDKLNFRSSFINSSPFSMYIMTTKNTITELKSYLKEDYTINCFIPFETKKISLNNVTAYIEGKDASAPPIILSAHFDHIGSDLAGNVYTGALDNASGTAFLLELSKYVQSLGKPERNILFVGFNAEEFGCLGSKAFVDEYKHSIKGSKVINFDMIGSNKPVPLYIMGGSKDTEKTALIKETSEICSKNKVTFNYLFEDASDHEYFRKQGIDAITLSDSDTSRIHTPSDKSEFISSDSIERCFNVVSKSIVKYGFKDNWLLIYYREVFWTSLIGITIFLGVNKKTT